MRNLSTWMAVIMVITGLCHQTLASDPCGPGAGPHHDEVAAAHHHDHEQHGEGEHPCEHPCDPAHDQNCPVEHHHHNGLCNSGMPLAADAHSRIASHVFRYSRTPVNLEDVSIPEEPVEELDKPPLI